MEEDGEVTDVDELREESEGGSVVVPAGPGLRQALEEDFDRVLGEYEDDFIGQV